MSTQPNFFIGWEYPQTPGRHGRIYLNRRHFANIYRQGSDWFKDGITKWCCNRDALAGEMGLLEQPFYASPEEMLLSLEKWFNKLVPTGYRSCAEWPEGVLTGANPLNISTDEHGTKEFAEAICKQLERDGFGGDHIHFPIRTWVEPIYLKTN